MELAEKLLQLQELEFVLDESRILHRRSDDDKTVQLSEKIAGLRKEIDTDYLVRFDRLRRQGLAVSRVNDGVCGGCRLNIPQGELIRMRKASTVPVCPNCGRFLAVSR